MKHITCHTLFTIMVVCAVLSGCNDTGTSPNWTFTPDNIDFGISGVSPEAILLEDGSVWTKQ